MQSLRMFLTDTIAAAPQKRVTVRSLMERYEVNSALGVAQNLIPKLSVTCIAASSWPGTEHILLFVLSLPATETLCFVHSLLHFTLQAPMGTDSQPQFTCKASARQKSRLADLYALPQFKCAQPPFPRSPHTTFWQWWKIQTAGRNLKVALPAEGSSLAQPSNILPLFSVLKLQIIES